MTKVDLITGFLGSGKTTFIKKYAGYLLDKGEKICILENDYGAINVDMMLLSELSEKGCDLEMVAGGCDYDCHIRRFKTKLITMAMLGYDRVIIEPSGIFDVDEFFDVLHEEPLDRLYEIGNVIAIVKADLEEDLSDEADYMLASQIADAGCVVLSRVQEADNEQINGTISHMNNALKKVKCNRKFNYISDEKTDKRIADTTQNHVKDARAAYDKDRLTVKNWDEFTAEDFELIENSGYKTESFEKKYSMDDNSFEPLFFMNIDMSLEKIKDTIGRLFKDTSIGKVIRIKGFARSNDKWYEINATEKEITTCEVPKGQDVIIVIGEKIDREKIDGYFEAKYSAVKTV